MSGWHGVTGCRTLALPRGTKSIVLRGLIPGAVRGDPGAGSWGCCHTRGLVPAVQLCSCGPAVAQPHQQDSARPPRALVPSAPSAPCQRALLVTGSSPSLGSRWLEGHPGTPGSLSSCWVGSQGLSANPGTAAPGTLTFTPHVCDRSQASMRRLLSKPQG